MPHIPWVWAHRAFHWLLHNCMMDNQSKMVGNSKLNDSSWNYIVATFILKKTSFIKSKIQHTKSEVHRSPWIYLYIFDKSWFLPYIFLCKLAVQKLQGKLYMWKACLGIKYQIMTTVSKNYSLASLKPYSRFSKERVLNVSIQEELSFYLSFSQISIQTFEFPATLPWFTH